MRRKRLNITRRRGKLYFRRETARLHDGTPDGEILWVMNSNKKPRRVVFIKPFIWPNGRRDVSIYIGHYRIVNAIRAAHMIRDYFKEV